VSEIAEHPPEGSRRLAKLFLSSELLAQLLALRPGLKIIAARYDAGDPDRNDGIVVTLEGDALPVVYLSGQIPIVGHEEVCA
jgi:hypothetical protein